MKRFENKIILVTGGTQGMGLVTAKKFAVEGAVVYISGRDQNKGENCVKEAKEQEIELNFIQCEITNSNDVKKMISEIVKRSSRLDCAFNNAGVTAKYGNVEDIEEEEWNRVVNINLNGTFICMKYEVQQMLKNNGGVIVNNSSIAGVVPYPGQSAYIASKSAINALTRAVAIEHAQGENCIRVNSIAPGPIIGGMNTKEKLAANPERTKKKTAFIAMKRFGNPEEVANTVLWLCSEESSFITGEVISIAGGAQAGKWWDD